MQVSLPFAFQLRSQIKTRVVSEIEQILPEIHVLMMK